MNNDWAGSLHKKAQKCGRNFHCQSHMGGGYAKAYVRNRVNSAASWQHKPKSTGNRSSQQKGDTTSLNSANTLTPRQFREPTPDLSQYQFYGHNSKFRNMA